jgi:hypothetical protein
VVWPAGAVVPQTVRLLANAEVAASKSRQTRVLKIDIQCDRLDRASRPLILVDGITSPPLL